MAGNCTRWHDPIRIFIADRPSPSRPQTRELLPTSFSGAVLSGVFQILDSTRLAFALAIDSLAGGLRCGLLAKNLRRWRSPYGRPT